MPALSSAPRRVSPLVVINVCPILFNKLGNWVGDNVYFRVHSSDKYGVLSNQKLDDLEVGSRIDVETDKEDPRDFVLWKLTSDEGIKWDTPFGKGRPGWHTECVVMINSLVKKYIEEGKLWNI